MKKLKTLFLALVLLATPAASSGQTIEFTGPALLENFDALGFSGTIAPTGWFAGWHSGALTNGTMTRTENLVVNPGGTLGPAATAGFNCGNSSDRALGLGPTSTGSPPGTNRFLEVQILNNSGQSLTNFTLRYDGEEWRTAGLVTQLSTNVFQFSTDGVNYVNMAGSFDFRPPVFSPANLPLDGNQSANRVPNLGGDYTPTTPVPPGATIYLRWLDVNDQGADPIAALDNFFFSAPGFPQPVSLITGPQNTSGVAGEAVGLFASAAGFPIFYQWFHNSQPVANATNAMLLFPNPSTNNSGVYFVVASNQFNSITSQTAILVVSLVLPVIQSAPTNTAAYVGGSLFLTVIHTRQVNYQWLKNGQPINGATQQSLFLTHVQVPDAGLYQVALSNAAGTVTTTHATVTVLTPSIPFDRYTNFWSYNDSGANQGTAWREPYFEDVLWSSGSGVLGAPLDEPLPGTLSVNTPLVLSNAGVRVITHYFVQRFTLPAPPENIVLTLASVLDDGAIFYLNGVEFGRVRMPAGNINYLTIASIATEIGNTPGRINELPIPFDLLVPGENYLAVEVHQGGAATSTDVIFGCGLNLVVQPDSPLTITNLPSNRVVLQGDAITFSAQVAGVGARYQWFKDGALLPGATRRDLVLSDAAPEDAALYQVFVSNTLNSVTGSVALAVVAPLTNRIITADFDLATLPSVVFSPTPVRYQWLLNGNDLPHQTNATLDLGTATLDRTGNYSLRVTHGTDTATASPAKLFVKPWFYTTLYANDFNAPVGGEWSLTDRSLTPIARRSFLGEFANNVLRLTLTNVPPHTEVNVSFDLFIIRSWDGDLAPDRWRLAVSNSAAFFDTTFGSPTQSFPHPYPGGGFQRGTGAAESFSLGYNYFGPSDNVYLLNRTFEHSGGTVIIEISGIGLETTATESWGLDNFVVSVGNIPNVAAPQLVATPTSQVVNSGGVAAFQVVATTRSPLTYQWKFNGADMAGETNAFLAASQAGWYSVEVRNSHGSVITEPVALGIVTSQPQSQTVNAGDTATFSVGSFGPGLTYQWRFNGLELVGQTNATLVLTNLGTNQAGFYSVIVHNGGIPLVSQAVELSVPQPGQPGSKLWEFQADSAIHSTAAIGSDGTVYVASLNGTLYAIGTNGQAKWQIPGLGRTHSSPAFLAQDRLILAALNKVYVIRTNGQIVWTYPLAREDLIQSSPAVARDGTIYLGDAYPETKLYALTPSGSNVWQFDSGGFVASSPAIGPDGAIYFGARDSQKVFSLDSVGTHRWERLTGGWVYSSPAIGPDGTVYIASEAGELYALAPDGSTRWISRTPSGISMSPALDTEGTVYVGDVSGLFCAFSSQGLTNWTVNLGGGLGIGTCAAISKDSIFIRADTGRLVALAYNGNKRWEFLMGGRFIEHMRPNPVISSEGVIYIGAADGKFYAINGDGPPAESAWPMFRRNSQHTGRMPLTFTAEPQSTSVLAGSSMTFTSAVSSLEPTTLQWRWNGTNLPHATNALLVLSNVQPQHAGSYAVLGSNASGGVLSRPAALSVTVQAPAIQQQPVNQTVALEETANFTATATGSGPLTYQWFRNSQSLPGATAATLILSNAQLADAGLYAWQVSNSAGSVTSTGALLTVLPFNGQWVSRDLGDVGLAGSATGSNGTFTVRGAGEDITGTSDAFFFFSQHFAGDGQIVARLVSLQNTDPQAEAGLMIRETLQTGARHVFLALSINQRAEFRRRLLPSNYSIENVGPGKVPGWLRLMRFGDTFTGHYSTNGVNWELVWWTTVPMSGTVEAGLAVTAHNAGRLATAIFDSVTTTGLTPLPGPWPGAQPQIIFGSESWNTPGYQPQGAFKFLIGGNVGDQLAVDSSSDLVTWRPLLLRTNTLGILDFQEALAPTNIAQIYRVRVISP